MLFLLQWVLAGECCKFFSIWRNLLEISTFEFLGKFHTTLPRLKQTTNKNKSNFFSRKCERKVKPNKPKWKSTNLLVISSWFGEKLQKFSKINEYEIFLYKNEMNKKIIKYGNTMVKNCKPLFISWMEKQCWMIKRQ